MKSAMRLFLVACLCAAAAAGAAPTRQKQPIVDDRGMDGDKRYYRVRCTDGATTRVLVANHEEGTICFQLEEERICLKTRDTDAAALRACSSF